MMHRESGPYFHILLGGWLAFLTIAQAESL